MVLRLATGLVCVGYGGNLDRIIFYTDLLAFRSCGLRVCLEASAGMNNSPTSAWVIGQH